LPGRWITPTGYLTDNDPAQLWQYYIQLVAVEEAFRNLKGDLAIRPIFHQDARTGPWRPGFPVEGDHRFRWMTTTCSGRWRPAPGL
jgi:hypothetical protein